MKQVALVIGATGVVGAKLTRELARSGDWRVFGCARAVPTDASRTPGVDYVVADLTDAAACRQLASVVQGITHLFYTARADFVTGRHEAADINATMFQNILDALEEARHPLRHVHMVHGTKYYGSTEGRYPTPARESAPRTNLRTFYYDHEDIVASRTARHWTWTASRPHAICDSSLATPRSLPLLIAAYATISRHIGEALSFPGTAGNYRAVYQCTDNALLARAIVWMSTDPKCADQSFNVTNGDFIRWENLWPVFARYFGMELGPVNTAKLAVSMADKAPLWRDIIAKYGLVNTPFERMALWSYGDFIFSPDWDMMSSTTKLRQFGFEEFVDTETMFLSFFDEYRGASIIPSRYLNSTM